VTNATQPEWLNTHPSSKISPV